ncbi:GAF domain-containing protein [Halobacillus massiliensis]|uniref:GAF domain-containing protein n=1 Tax=Halobacillus massiliensis TaxID=1926286 RepID=UPI0015C4BE2B|nr:GAF domain-containing protein [Halobacillus massiliensis]
MEFNKGSEDMGYRKEWIQSECDTLKSAIPCDFAGVALQKPEGLDVTWPYAVGNRNEKYKYITVRYGKGIAGKVISSGSPMEINHFPEKIMGKSTDYPIMLAEQLLSAYAVPLVWNTSLKGALLIGYREKHIVTAEEKNKVNDIARKIESFLSECREG